MVKLTLKGRIDQLGDLLIEGFHVVGLFVIGGTIVWSAIGEYLVIAVGLLRFTEKEFDNKNECFK